MRITASATKDSSGRELWNGLSLAEGIKNEPMTDEKKIKRAKPPENYLIVDRIDRFFDENWIELNPKMSKYSLCASIARNYSINNASPAMVASEHGILFMKIGGTIIKCSRGRYVVESVQGERKEACK